MINEFYFIFYLQALLHASVACHRKLIVEWIAADDLEDVTAKEVSTVFNFLHCRFFVYYYLIY